MGKIKRSIGFLAYRMKLRKALQDSSDDQLRITKEETQKEMNRRKIK